jgi:hypothetical protein
MQVNILKQNHSFIVYSRRLSHVPDHPYVMHEVILNRERCAQMGPDRHRARYKLTLRGDVDRERELHDPWTRTVYVQSHINDDLFVSTAGYICQYSCYSTVECSNEQYHREIAPDPDSPHLHFSRMPDCICLERRRNTDLGISEDKFLYKFINRSRGRLWYKDTLGMMGNYLLPQTDDDVDDPYELSVGDRLLAIDDIHKQQNPLECWHPGEYVVRVMHFFDYGYFLSDGGYLCNARNYRKFNPLKYLLLD